MNDDEDQIVREHMISTLRGRDDNLCSDAADEIERLIRLSGVGLISAGESFERRLSEAKAETALRKQESLRHYDLYIAQRKRADAAEEALAIATTDKIKLLDAIGPIPASQRGT